MRYVKEHYYGDDHAKAISATHQAQIESIRKEIVHDLQKASKKKVARLADQLIEKPVQQEEQIKVEKEAAEKQTIFSYEV